MQQFDIASLTLRPERVFVCTCLHLQWSWYSLCTCLHLPWSGYLFVYAARVSDGWGYSLCTCLYLQHGYRMGVLTVYLFAYAVCLSDRRGYSMCACLHTQCGYRTEGGYSLCTCLYMQLGYGWTGYLLCACLYLQRGYRTDGGSHHHGDRDVSDGGEPGRLPSGHRAPDARPASHAHPNLRESLFGFVFEGRAALSQ